MAHTGIYFSGALSDCGCQSSVQRGTDGLGDFPFEWFTKSLFGGDLDAAVIEVRRAVINVNYEWGCEALLVDCLPYDVVQNVLETYINLATAAKIPQYEYDERLRPGFQYRNANTRRIIEAIVEATGIGWDIIMWCLEQLWRGVHDGRIADGYKILKPYTAVHHPEVYKTPDNVGSLDKTTKDAAGAIGTAFDDITSLLKWVLIAVIVGGVAYVGYQAYLAYEEGSSVVEAAKNAIPRPRRRAVAAGSSTQQSAEEVAA